MNRRKFLGLLAVAPLAIKAMAVTPPITATISQYVDYASFGDLANAGAIDAVVQQAALELGYRAGLTVDALYMQAFQ